MLEMVLELGSPLNPGVADVADFGGVELLPFLAVKLLVEFGDEFGVDEVEKGVPNIAVVLNKKRDTL